MAARNSKFMLTWGEEGEESHVRPKRRKDQASNPKRRKSFRARHSCDKQKPKDSAAIGHVGSGEMKNYGYTVSWSSRGSKKRSRSMAIFRTKREAESKMKILKATAKAFGASNLRVVKATKRNMIEWLEPNAERSV